MFLGRKLPNSVMFLGQVPSEQFLRVLSHRKSSRPTLCFTLLVERFHLHYRTVMIPILRAEVFILVHEFEVSLQDGILFASLSILMTLTF